MTACHEVRNALRGDWIEGKIVPRRRDGRESEGPRRTGETLPDRTHLPAWTGAGVNEHLEACEECRHEVEELLLLDRSLASGFRYLGSLVEGPSERRLDEVVRRVREESPEVTLIRRIRRPTRALLWVAFYFFTLLACMLLAVALYKSLSQ